MIPNLNHGDFKKLITRIESLERANPLSNSSLGRGRMRFYDGSILLIENGALNVTGTATISGTLNGSGIIDFTGQLTQTGGSVFTGPTIFDGPVGITQTLDVTAETKLRGDTTIEANLELLDGGLFKAGSSVINPDGSATFGLFDIAANGDLKSKGALSIEGPTSLKNDLTVEAGKKITLGGLTLENQGTNSAEVQMPGGGLSSSTLLGMLLVHDSVTIGGATRVKLESPDIRMTGIQPKVGASPNLYMDANGQLWRTP